MTAPDDRRWKLEADLGEKAFDHLSDYYRWPMRVDGESYVLVDDETFSKLAGDDGARLFVQRESDGELFEIEVDVTAYPAKVVDGEDQ